MEILTVNFSDPQSPADARKILLEVLDTLAVRNKVKIALGNASGEDRTEMQVVGAQQNPNGTISVTLRYPQGGEETTVVTDEEGRLKGYRVVEYKAP